MTTGRKGKTGPGAFLGETGMKFIAPGTGPSPRARMRPGAYSISLPSPRGNASAPTDGTQAWGALGSPRSKSIISIARAPDLELQREHGRAYSHPWAGKSLAVLASELLCVSVSLQVETREEGYLLTLWQ